MRINKEETYGGQLYKFKIGKSIGKGGNGEVFEANIINWLCFNKLLKFD